MPQQITVVIPDGATVTVAGGDELVPRQTVPVQLEPLNRERIARKLGQAIDVLEGQAWTNATAAERAEILRRVSVWLLRLQAGRFDTEGPALPAS